MGKNIDKRVWGVLGKQQTYFSPQKQVEGKIKTPLNANAFDSWDAKRSRFKRVDGYENAVQQGGVVPQGTASPATSPTPTPTITQTQTQTNTPTPSITPTFTPTPSSTPYPLPLYPTIWFDASDNTTLTTISSGGTDYVSFWNSKGTSTWSLSGVSTDTMPVLSASTLMPGNPNCVRFTTNATASLRDYMVSFNNTPIGHTGSTIFQVWAKPSGSTYATALSATRVYSGLTNGGTAGGGAFPIDQQLFNTASNGNLSNSQTYSSGSTSSSANLSIPAYSAAALNDKFILQVRTPFTAGQFTTFELNQSGGTGASAFTGTTIIPTINSFNLGLGGIATGGTISTTNQNIELCEIIYFDTVLSDNQVEQVELYLKDKWRYDEWASPVPTPTNTPSSTQTPTPSITPTMTNTPSTTPPILTIESFTGTTTWTAPYDASIIVECWGGGGGGGAARRFTGSATAAGGGGAGGSYAKKTISVISGTTYTINVGLGGTKMSIDGSGGLPGGATWFSASTLVYAAGGGAGGFGNSATATPFGSGGTASNASIGDIIYSGGDGMSGTTTFGGGAGGGAGSSSNGSSATSDTGGNGGTGNAEGGNGANGSLVNGNGSQGNTTGGGGSGGYWDTTSGSSTGGDGARGLLKITY
jgi:hypothetical protein